MDSCLWNLHTKYEKGNVFTGVCLFTLGREGVSVLAGEFLSWEGEGSLCPDGLCPREGVFVWGQDLCPGGSLSGGGGHCTRGVSVRQK